MIQPTPNNNNSETNQDLIPTSSSSTTQQPPIRLVDIPITDDQVAFNLIVQFVQLAQKRGSYQMEESSKIWECLKRFQR